MKLYEGIAESRDRETALGREFFVNALSAGDAPSEARGDYEL